MNLFRVLIALVIVPLVGYYVMVIIHAIWGFFPFEIDIRKAMIPFYYIIKLLKNNNKV